MPKDRYQTVQELALRLEVAEATVRLWIKSGRLRAIHIGKGWRIADTDLVRFLKAHETAPRDQAVDPSAGPGGLTGPQEPENDDDQATCRGLPVWPRDSRDHGDDNTTGKRNCTN